MLRRSVTFTALFAAAGMCVAVGLGTAAWGQNTANAGIGDAGAGVGVLSTGTGPHALADAAYKAMGLTDEKLAPAVVTLMVKGSVQAWDPGESESVNDPYKPDWGTSTYTESYDRARGLYRIEWMRPRAGGGMRNYTEILTDEYGPSMSGYVIGVDVNGGQPSRAIMINGMPAHQMSGKRLTATLRELERYTVMGDMHEHPERVSEIADQKAGGKTYKAAQYRADHGTFIVMFDPATHLPAIVRTRDWDVHYGDSDYDETLSDWRDVGMGIKLPFHRLITINGIKIFDEKLDNVRLNPQLAVDAFTVPAALRRGAPAAAPTGEVPYQWILRRMGNGFYLDSDALYTDDGGSLKLVDIAPNISMVQGGSHNTLIVATNSYLVTFDAPGDDGMSNKVLEMAAAKYPGKPLRYVVLTHHHIDHTGGLRALSAAGATVVVGKGNGAFFRKMLSAPAGMNLYPIKGKVQPKVIEVDGKWSVNDGGREIDAFSLSTSHATGYIIPYIPDAKLGWVTDLWNPGGLVTMSNPALVDLVNGVKKMGIQPERFAGGHGAVGNYADVVKAVGG
ncbi:MAG TPA: MBL fold metallo-hydrolase [Micropepsaceae bacterium]|jgi:glyoxylase-like metal-dependent hydrolase (beta-lactamase superfamily II)|nr:MBL fold metallo-hydrolase [Micropepsaceae bacterium]